MPNWSDLPKKYGQNTKSKYRNWNVYFLFAPQVGGAKFNPLRTIFAFKSKNIKA
jgi:hypothetical protein